MPESPPKRVTRSRAKATGDVEPQSKVTIITTESAKVSAESKRRVASAKTTKRKTRADAANVNAKVEATVEEVPKEPSIRQGKQRKVKDEAKEKLLKVKVPATTGSRSTKTVVPEETSAEAPKPRGRPRKAPSSINDVTTGSKGPEDLAMVKRSIRGRPAAIIAKPRTVNQVTKAPTTRKKVKFEDEKDKENIPLQGPVLEKPALKANGMKAKPIRKPTSAKTSRGKKTDNEEKNISTEESTEQPRSQPLSPKKVVQVAKSCSVSSEDELCGDKTPVRALSRSPVKPPMSPIREIDQPVAKLDFGSAKAPSSPERIMSSNILASPARRPPSSPFKNAFKESPKRVNLGDSFVHTVSLVAPNSPVKASLLQSPARRLAASTIKLNPQASPVKSAPAMPVVDTATALKQTKASSFSELSLEKAVSSPLRALGSPGQSFKVYKTTALEHRAESDKTSNTPDQSSSLRSGTAREILPNSPPVTDHVVFAVDAHSALNMASSPVSMIGSASVDCQKPASDRISEETETSNKIQPTPTTFQSPIPVASAFKFAFNSLRSAAEDSESEDELTSSHKSRVPTQFGSHGVSNNYTAIPESVLTRTGAKMKNPPTSESGVSMTPLATQLSSWLASTPEKKTHTEPSEWKRGLFSPVGATLLDRSERSHTPSSLESPPKSSFFDDEMAAREEDEDNTTHTQSKNQEVLTEIQASQESQGSEQYGDENAMPLDLRVHAPEPTSHDLISTCTPAKVFSSQPREIHTVSKVPLRPAGEDSPIKIPRKRSRSLAGPLTVVESPEKYEFGYSNDALTFVGSSSASNDAMSEDFSNENHAAPVKFLPNMSQTPGTGILSNLGSPVRTIRKGVVPDVLKGAVVYVDVHTTEGADASGIFFDLLTQMGARCVKQWPWNPRSGTSGSSGDDAANTSPDAETPGGKVGITHVVYKDGGKRTLEKVREAKGVVLCVGVGWVLE